MHIHEKEPVKISNQIKAHQMIKNTNTKQNGRATGSLHQHHLLQYFGFKSQSHCHCLYSFPHHPLVVQTRDNAIDPNS